jgi:hypothetical protein
MGGPNRFNGYYIGFDPTGEEPIDVILSAVARAGKAYHHTESWGEPTPPYEPEFRGESPVDWIQNAATDAAGMMRRAYAVIVRAVAHAGPCRIAHEPTCPCAPGMWMRNGEPFEGGRTEEECECWVRDAKNYLRDAHVPCSAKATDR